MNECGHHKGGTILMVFMFRGNYLRDNLGHEIINVFQDDKGDHYIYVNPWGHVNEKDFGKIETILLVRHVGKHRAKIIAKAWGLSDPFPHATDKHEKNISPEELDSIKRDQSNACKGIKYGKKELAKVFGFNTKNDRQRILVTYKADCFLRTKETENAYLDFSDKEKTGSMPSHPLKGYYPPNSDDAQKRYMYEKLEKIINNDNNWEEEDSSKVICFGKPTKKQFNILDVIGKEDDELAFSNWFWFLFNSNKEMLCRFATDVNALGLEQPLSHHAIIKREIKNIDLLITDLETNQIIVIENKIKSDINGLTKKDKDDHDTQADVSYTGNKTKRPIFNNQLEKYKWIAEHEIAIDEGLPEGTTPKCYIFLPNYSRIDEDKFKKEGYKAVRYKEIYGFIAGLGGRDITPEYILEAYEKTKVPENDVTWIGLKEE